MVVRHLVEQMKLKPGIGQQQRVVLRMDVDQLASQVEEAAKLIKACKEKLFTTNATIEKMLKDLDK